MDGAIFVSVGGSILKKHQLDALSTVVHYFMHLHAHLHYLI